MIDGLLAPTIALHTHLVPRVISSSGAALATALWPSADSTGLDWIHSVVLKS